MERHQAGMEPSSRKGRGGGVNGGPNRGRDRAVRRVLRAGVQALAALALLAGCAVRPEPLTPADTAQRVETDLARLQVRQPLLDGPLTLHGAMARALLHNPDTHVQTMERDLALRQIELARLGLLPALTGRYGVETRSNVQGSSSRSVATGRESLSASTSSDRPRNTGNLGAVWNVLDFGVSYYGAKQQADRALIAHESRRRAVHAAVAEVRRAWWRAVAAERALGRLEPLLTRVRAALEDSTRLAAENMREPVAALRYQRELLAAVDTLERQRRESRLARIELARLIGLAPGTDYKLAIPASAPKPRALGISADNLARLALAHHPELRAGQLEERVALGEVKKAMLRLLPGLELRAGAHVDNNSYLVNNDWVSLGAAVTVNLTELFSGPAAIDRARAGQELAAARREALSMAVLAQFYVALARFEEAQAQYVTAARIADLEQRIVEALQSGSRYGVVDRLQTIRAEIGVLQALLARDIGLAEVEDGFGRIFLAVGADILPVDAAQPTLDDVAAAIAATEEAWSQGEVAMQSWRETAFH